MYDESLVIDNENLIYHILKKLHLYDQREEYYDIGMIGLVKAAKTFDETKGYKFNTYAVSIIFNEILGYRRKENSDKRKIIYNSISLNTIVYENITLEETIENNVDIEQELIKKEQIKELYKAISLLKAEDQIVLKYSYGLNNCHRLTQNEIADLLNKSQAQVSRIRIRAIKQLKKHLKGEINNG